MIAAGTGSKIRAKTGSPTAPTPRLVIVTPSCMAAMNRAGFDGDAQDDAGPTASLVAKLGEARASRGHQGVLGRDEERVQQKQASDRKKLKAESHAAPLSGARGLGGWSSSTALVSEYR